MACVLGMIGLRCLLERRGPGQIGLGVAYLVVATAVKSPVAFVFCVFYLGLRIQHAPRSLRF
ncbi:MAG: hypothetical protein AAGC57_10825 [Pseudomonadota bacterium]